MIIPYKKPRSQISHARRANKAHDPISWKKKLSSSQHSALSPQINLKISHTPFYHSPTTSAGVSPPSSPPQSSSPSPSTTSTPSPSRTKPSSSLATSSSPSNSSPSTFTKHLFLIPRLIKSRDAITTPFCFSSCSARSTNKTQKRFRPPRRRNGL